MIYVAFREPYKGVPSAVGFPHCAGSGEGLSLSLKPYPHKCVEAGARTRDLPVTDGRLYRWTRPALLLESHIKNEIIKSQLVRALSNGDDNKSSSAEPLPSMCLACGASTFEVWMTLPKWAAQVNFLQSFQLMR